MDQWRWAGKRVDLKSGKVDSYERFSGYQVVVNSKGQPFITIGDIKMLDLATKEVKILSVPTKNSFTRRGKVDAQDRFWFAEYGGDKIGMLDTRTLQFKEWPTRKYWTPYAASLPDKKGYVYATGNMTDQLLRLDPKTGETVEYLMPTELDSKKIAVAPNGAVWMANMRTARVLRVEPLD